MRLTIVTNICYWALAAQASEDRPINTNTPLMPMGHFSVLSESKISPQGSHSTGVGGSDADYFVANLFEEARQTYQVLLEAKYPPSLGEITGIADDGTSMLPLDEFVTTYVTLALEKETERVLKAKGYSLKSLGLFETVRGEKEGSGGDPRSVLGESMAAVGSVVRKKDAPTTTGGMLEQLRVQRRQAEAVAATAWWPQKPRLDIFDPRGPHDDDANRSGEGDGDDGQRQKVAKEMHPQEIDNYTTHNKTSSFSTLSSLWVVECAEPLYSQHWYPPIVACSPGAETHSSPPLDLFKAPASSSLKEAKDEDSQKTVEEDRSMKAGVQASRMMTCGRAMVDGIASQEECSRIVAMADTAMENLFHQGGATSLVPDGQAASRSQKRFGPTGLQLLTRLRARVKAQVELAHGLELGTLFVAGSLLTRLRAEDEFFVEGDAWERNASHVYWNSHVDKANIASYDYSALLYFSNQHRSSYLSQNTEDWKAEREIDGKAGGQFYVKTTSGSGEENVEGHAAAAETLVKEGGVREEAVAVANDQPGGARMKDLYLVEHADNNDQGSDQRVVNEFEGGSFVFQDVDADRTVAPSCGRLITFTSGLENVHRVEKVTKGSRLVLALWFTCSPNHAAAAAD